jgi:hypothetical protein
LAAVAVVATTVAAALVVSIKRQMFRSLLDLQFLLFPLEMAAQDQRILLMQRELVVTDRLPRS